MVLCPWLTVCLIGSASRNVMCFFLVFVNSDLWTKNYSVFFFNWLSHKKFFYCFAGTHSLCCVQSGSSWWRPGWPCHWSWAHEKLFLRSTLASYCEALSDFPSFYSDALSTSRHSPASIWQNIRQRGKKQQTAKLIWFYNLVFCCSHNNTLNQAAGSEA